MTMSCGYVVKDNYKDSSSMFLVGNTAKIIRFEYTIAEPQVWCLVASLSSHAIRIRKPTRFGVRRVARLRISLMSHAKCTNS